MSHPIGLRDVEEQDIDQIVLMNRAAVPAVNDISADDFRWFKDHASYFRVAVDDNQEQPVGLLVVLEPGRDYASANYQWFCARYDSFAYVDRIVIDQSCRGGGVGSLLYNDLMAWAQTVVPRVTCEVNKRPPNPQSMGFHERFGFVEVGEQETEGGAKTVALLSCEPPRKPS